LIVVPRIASAVALIVVASSVASASECGDPATRVVEINQRILQLLPPRAELTRFVLDDSKPASDRDRCEMKISVSLTTERNAQAHALAEALRKEPQVAAVEITQTRVAPTPVVQTDLTLTLR
jgi:hypothetical protein